MQLPDNPLLDAENIWHSEPGKSSLRSRHIRCRALQRSTICPCFASPLWGVLPQEALAASRDSDPSNPHQPVGSPHTSAFTVNAHLHPIDFTQDADIAFAARIRKTMPRKPVQDFFLFLLGGALFAAGIFLFTNQVMVGSGIVGMGWGRRYGGGFGSTIGGIFSSGTGQGFGLLMIPFGVGAALLLADAYRKAGWFLVWASSAAIGAGVLQSLVFSFRLTNLWSLMTMVVMIAGGGGLMFKSLRDYQGEERERRRIELDDSSQSLNEIREELELLKSRINKD